jgi:hypothetical protein
MGHRIIVEKQTATKIGSNSFKNYGAHSDSYSELPYLTFACAVGTQENEIVEFFKRLEEGIKELKQNVSKEKKKKALKVEQKPEMAQ